MPQVVIKIEMLLQPNSETAVYFLFTIFCLVLVLKRLNKGQGQRHPSAGWQLRTDKTDQSCPHIPHPRRAASERCAFFLPVLLARCYFLHHDVPPLPHPSFGPK